MKKTMYLLVLGVLVFTACQKNETTGTELPRANLLAVDVDGSTAMIVDNLKLALVGDTIVTDEELNGLLWMREEEKVAGDLYSIFYDNYGLRIFGNIAKSEDSHMSAVHYLLESFNIGDPAYEELGKFKDETLQQVFDELKTAGEVSLVEALKVGAYVEELDILDLEEQLEIVENNDIRVVYENLLRGSRNHLRAFTRVLTQNDVTYQPTVLTDDYYNEIISGQMERGNGGANSASGYKYANRNGAQNPSHYNTQNASCDSIPAYNNWGKQNRYGNRGGN